MMIPFPSPIVGTGARPRHRRRARIVRGTAAGLAGLALVAVLAVRCAARSSASDSADPSVSAFFARYVQPDGRVVRLDQGGDTVSEGQAYAMLLAERHGDRQRFAATWEWATQHLQRPDGLLSWHWNQGRVLDPMPATDADVYVALSLLRAAGRFQSPFYRAKGLEMALAVLTEETVGRGGHLVLVAGPWARGEPAVVNPGYFDPSSFRELAQLTGDSRWAELAADSLHLIGQLTGGGTRLPPDWAAVGTDGLATPSRKPGAPGQSAVPPRFGIEVARLEILLAAGCDPVGRQLAARAWSLLGQGPPAAPRDLDGRALAEGPEPVLAIAAGAAAQAAGDPSASRLLLATARSLAQAEPTYYGAAWVALAGSVFGHQSTTCKGAS
jgi:endoglucanase